MALQDQEIRARRLKAQMAARTRTVGMASVLLHPAAIERSVRDLLEVCRGRSGEPRPPSEQTSTQPLRVRYS
jgi:hypothetical protein